MEIIVYSGNIGESQSTVHYYISSNLTEVLKQFGYRLIIVNSRIVFEFKKWGNLEQKREFTNVSKIFVSRLRIIIECQLRGKTVNHVYDNWGRLIVDEMIFEKENSNVDDIQISYVHINNGHESSGSLSLSGRVSIGDYKIEQLENGNIGFLVSGNKIRECPPGITNIQSYENDHICVYYSGVFGRDERNCGFDYEGN